MTNIFSTETVLPDDSLKANKRWNGFIFVITMWLLSRLVIIIAMQLLAPLIYTSPFHGDTDLSVLGFVPGYIPKTSWELFTHWDGQWYKRIATIGYEYANDGQNHSIAFFPLFPLLTRGVMSLSLPFEVAGTLVNNLGFLGAMFFLYLWTQERHGISAAKWSTAVLAWCPFSLFATVTYTEGLFLLLTTAGLRAFDNRQYVWAALWGAMATATRPTGITLIPTFLFIAWRERRPVVAYVASLAAGTGLLLFSVYCAIRFGDPLAFVHVQKAWPQQSWLYVFQQALTGSPAHIIKFMMVFGGGFVLWHTRHKLSRVAFAYGFCSLALIFSLGFLNSVGRFAYSIVSLSLALGVLLSRHRRWGYGIIGLFIILLVGAGIRFAGWRWIS